MQEKERKERGMECWGKGQLMGLHTPSDTPPTSAEVLPPPGTMKGLKRGAAQTHLKRVRIAKFP